MADDDTFRVLWHTPTEYNPLRHGPPYLPGTPYEPAKLSTEQRAKVRNLAKNAAVVPAQLDPSIQVPSLTTLLGALQGASLVHQTHHWSTLGPTYYGDHLLFERLYNESQEFIDQVAERMMGLGASAVVAVAQTRVMSAFVQQCGLARTPDEMAQVSLTAELLILNIVKRVLDTFDASETLTPGTSNLLEGLADKHEAFVYLLQQRTKTASVPETPTVYSYDRT
jgi:starvation-inducible DNA-binding protein